RAGNQLREETVGIFTVRRAAMGVAAIFVLAAVTLVYAAWTTTGQGSGYAKATSAQPLSTVDVSAQTTASLYPGSSGDVLIKVHNPNPFAVRVTDVTLRGAAGDIAVDGGHEACSPTGVTFTDQPRLSLDVAASSDNQATL